jgi:O-antigen/teichoic acid export membrane protein
MLFSSMLRYLSTAQASLLGGLGVTGGAFAIARVIQFAGAVWLTRMLSVQDFAILAVISAIQAFATQITFVNLGSELVRCKKLDPHDVQIAWTYELLRNVLVWAIIFVPADAWANMLNRPDAATALRISSLSLLILSLRNPNMVQIRREKLFTLLGVMDVLSSMVLALFSVVWVALTGDFIGVIYAGLASAFSSVVCSYLAFPIRPKLRFSLHRAAPMLNFGGKLFIAGVASAMESNAPVFLVSLLGDSQDVGYLNRAWAFSTALAVSISGLIWRVCYPHYSQISLSGGSALAHASCISLIIVITGLAGAGVVSLQSEAIVGTLLGQEWTPISQLWMLLLVSSVLSLAASPLGAALQAERHESAQVIVYCTCAVAAVILYWILYSSHGLSGLGIASIVGNTMVWLGYLTLARAMARRSL